MENDFLLDEDLHKELILIPASKGKRFFNYIIDLIFAMIVFVLFIGVLVGIGIISEDVFLEEGNSNVWIENIISVLLMTIIYCIIESAFNGKTVGKFFTKTRVLTEDGEIPSVGTIIKRSLCRMIPFDGLSFLGSNPYGWHDTISKTIVVDENLSTF